ncbi:MAG: RbsD/FucU domain-containing protein [Streptomycetales bacterium]
MKRDGILHAQLCGALARLGHGDVVVVADCGCPCPVARSSSTSPSPSASRRSPPFSTG